MNKKWQRTFETPWAQLFESRFTLNPGLNLTRVSFSSLCSKAFCWVIFSVIFRASNHQLPSRQKELKLKCFAFKSEFKTSTNPGLS